LGEGYLRHGVTSAMVTGTRNDTGTMVEAQILNDAGNRLGVVKKRAPLDPNSWGGTSNRADILVRFSYTITWSYNKY